MKGRAPNAEEKRWMQSVRDNGCIVCLLFNEVYTPTAVHHIDGKTKEGAHMLTIGLCGNHHQHKDTHKPQRWVSRHGDGRRAFEAAYGTELELLEKTKEMICG